MKKYNNEKSKIDFEVTVVECLYKITSIPVKEPLVMQLLHTRLIESDELHPDAEVVKIFLGQPMQLQKLVVRIVILCELFNSFDFLSKEPGSQQQNFQEMCSLVSDEIKQSLRDVSTHLTQPHQNNIVNKILDHNGITSIIQL